MTRDRFGEIVTASVRPGRPVGFTRRPQSPGSSGSRRAHRYPAANSASGADVEKTVTKLSFLGGLAAAATARGPLGGWLADQFGGPDRGNELFHAVIIEINRSTFGI
jgi:hypothetical protein